MTSVEPKSSAAFSSLIWELDSGVTDIFGPAPFNTTTYPKGGRLWRSLRKLRDKRFPRVMRSLNNAEISIVHRARVTDPADPLGYTWSENTEHVFAAVVGATIENVERGLLAASDYEAVVAAADIASPLSPEDAVLFNGVRYDVAGLLAYPKIPFAVGYRLMLKRAA